MRRRVVIVGAGLAGSVLAHRLSHEHDVIVVEPAAEPRTLITPVRDVGVPATLSPHVGSGLGGTTAFWANGLIEPLPETFAAWPISANDLATFVSPAFHALSGVNKDVVDRAAATLRDMHAERGVPPALLRNYLYYPTRRRNLWATGSGDRASIKVVHALCTGVEHNAAGRVRAVRVAADGEEGRIPGDVFVISAGGLSTPVLMQAIAAAEGINLPAAGHHYNDHPAGFVGIVELSAKLDDIWNHAQPGIVGTLRTPFVIKEEGLQFSYYLRPIVQYNSIRTGQRFDSNLVNLMNNPFNLSNAMRLLRNYNDIIDIVSFKFHRRLPTKRFVILTAAEQPPAQHNAVHTAPDGAIVRDWRIDLAYRATMQRAFDRFLAALAPITTDAHVFPDWHDTLESGAHHSGACRMAEDARSGVVDADLKVFGFDNLFICDGSVVPSTGFANTGLTIAALALRLARHIEEAST